MHCMPCASLPACMHAWRVRGCCCIVAQSDCRALAHYLTWASPIMCTLRLKCLRSRSPGSWGSMSQPPFPKTQNDAWGLACTPNKSKYAEESRGTWSGAVCARCVCVRGECACVWESVCVCACVCVCVCVCVCNQACVCVGVVCVCVCVRVFVRVQVCKSVCE